MAVQFFSFSSSSLFFSEETLGIKNSRDKICQITSDTLVPTLVSQSLADYASNDHGRGVQMIYVMLVTKFVKSHQTHIF